MPKILRPIEEVERSTILEDPVAGDVHQVPAFPEPDHAPEVAEALRYERLRTVSLRGVVEEEPGGDEAPEIPTEGRRGWDQPALPSEVDHLHDCDQPDHAVAHMLYNVEHGWPPSRDYFTCRGFRRLTARTISDLRSGL